MSRLDPRLASALAAQFETRRQAMASGAQRSGWKLGVGSSEQIGSGPVLGHLLSTSQLAPGSAFRARDSVALHADAELVLILGREIDSGAEAELLGAAIVGYAAGLEIVDLGNRHEDAQSIVAHNIFHRGFVVGDVRREAPRGGLEAQLIVNGEVRASATATPEPLEAMRVVAEQLGAMGERLERGDVIFTGNIVQVPIQPGDEVIAELGSLGQARARIES